MTDELTRLEECFAKSTNIYTKRLCPNILLSADEEKAQNFAKKYCDILMNNDVLTELFLPDSISFLELEFPEPGSESHKFDCFFDMPYEHALGDFYGVLLINLKHWEKASLFDYHFNELLEFVKETSQTARFVFCFSETAKNFDQMKELLGRQCNLFEIQIGRPDIYDAEAFVKKELMTQGIYITDIALKELQELLKKVTEEASYEGEASLKKFAENLSFQYLLAQSCEKKDIQEIYKKTGLMYLKADQMNQQKIGFRR